MKSTTDWCIKRKAYLYNKYLAIDKGGVSYKTEGEVCIQHH
jgi:hypothetical protein